VTVTVLAADGSVNVTDAEPEPSVVAITLEPEAVPFDSVPAFALKKILAPLAGFAPPELPGARFTESGTGKVLPWRPV
jgi:hypothetical protein